MPIANINSVKLNYEVSGQGKDIVLLHGYVGDIQDWKNQIALLSPKYRVSVLDQRGRGKSEADDRGKWSFGNPRFSASDLRRSGAIYPVAAEPDC